MLFLEKSVFLVLIFKHLFNKFFKPILIFLSPLNNILFCSLIYSPKKKAIILLVLIGSNKSFINLWNTTTFSSKLNLFIKSLIISLLIKFILSSILSIPININNIKASRRP